MNDIVNPLQNTSYTNKDFVSVYTELLDLVKQLTSKWDPSISNESDPGVVLLKLNALIADKCNYAIDKNVLECFPMSVTQETNARHLFEQLGYYMHWYKSATTQVALTWVGDDQYASASGYYIIPSFTMVTDADNSVIYTLIGPYEGTDNNTFIVGDMQLPCTGSNRTIRMKAIQGVAVDYTVGGSVLITPDKLDENNRLYFDTNDVAQNGIFISNVNRNNYAQWIQKDNLLIENIGNTYYSFGVTDDGASCYLQFPDDVYNIFEDGVVIKYIKTDEQYGNISANTLSKFHADFTAYDEQGNIQLSVEGQQIAMSGDLIKIVNPSSANNGLDKETIDEAYKGYKSVVGTFQTLVTLRDYINAIKQSGLVSNDFVCDRTNDIQTTYKLVPAVSDSDTLITVSESDNTLNAFTLKIYATQYVLNPQTKLEFNNSFYMLPNDSQANIKSYIENQKTIVHDFGDLIPPDDDFSHICYFKNKYPIECTVIPQSNLSNVQKKLIIDNIKLALYKNLNASQVEFGDEISYQFVYDVIKNADNRISAISLNTISYETYAVYYVSGMQITYDGSTGKWYDQYYNVVEPTEYLLFPEHPVTGAIEILPDHFREISISTEDEEPIVVSKPKQTYEVKVDKETYMQNFGCDNWYKKQKFTCTSSTEILRLVRQTYNSSTGTYSDATPYESHSLTEFESLFGVHFTGDVPKNSTINFTLGSGDVGINFSPGDETQTEASISNQTTLNNAVKSNNSWYFKYKIVDYNYTWQLNEDVGEVDITDYGISIEENIDTETGLPVEQLQPNDVFFTNVSLKTQMQNEIYAKSVLAGKTQFFIQDETFDYRLDQIYLDVIDDIEYISTNVDVEFNQFWDGNSNAANNKTTYLLKENEYLQFYCPNLLDSTSYSTYVKMEYILNRDINADTNFELQPGEFIIFYWKTSSDEDGALYDYAVYGPYNIFNTTFAIPHYTDVSNIAGYTLIERDLNGNILDSSITGANKMTVDISNRINSITNAKNILSGTKKITLKKLAEINITSNNGYYMYWVVNTRVGNSYRLFEAINGYETGIEYNIGDVFTYQSQIYLVNSTISAAMNTNFENIYSHISTTVQSRVLNQGEYFIYTDATQTNMSILGAGTKITRNVADFNWDVTIMDATDITSYGIDAFYDETTETSYWFTNIGNATIQIIENQFITLSPNQKIKITPKDISNVYTLTHSVSNSGGTASFSDNDLEINVSLLYSAIEPQLSNSSKQYQIKYNGTNWILINGSTQTSISDLYDYGIQINRLDCEYDASQELSINRGTYEFTWASSTSNWSVKYNNVSQSSINNTQLKNTYALIVDTSTLKNGDKIIYQYLEGAYTPIVTIEQSYTNNDCINLTITDSWQLLIDSKGYTVNVPQGSHADAPTLSDFDVQYKLENSTEYVSLPDVSLQSYQGWEVYSLLAINTNNLLSQRINQNQTVSYKRVGSDDYIDIKPQFVNNELPSYDNLKNTVWLFNEHVNTGLVNSTEVKAYYDVTFINDGTTYTKMSFPNNGSTAFDKDIYYGSTKVYDGITDTWVDDKYRLITITGGTDITTQSADQTAFKQLFTSIDYHRYNAKDLTCYPTMLSSQPINNYGGNDINVTDVDDEGNLIYPSIYLFANVYDYYNQQILDRNVIYTEDGSAVFQFEADSTSESIRLALPVGEYILPLKHQYEGIESITVTLYVTKPDGATTGVLLHNMGDETITNFAAPSAYYLYLPITSTDIFELQIDISGHNKLVNIKLDNCYKYVKPENISDNQFEIIQDLIFKLSTNLKYKYTHVNDPTTNIENPLDAFQFLNSNHIYNKNTICQLDNYIVNWG